MFAPWFKHLPKDISSNQLDSTLNSLNELFELSFKQFSEKPAFINMGTTLTFRALEQRSRNIACYLQQSLKYKKGTRVAIMMPNILQYPIVLLGILRAGMIVVNVNPLYTARELKHQVKDAGAEVIFIIENVAHTLSEVIEELPIKHVVITQVADELPFYKRNFLNFAMKYLKRKILPYSLPKANSYLTALSLGKLNCYQCPALKGDDIAFIQYTGGTTGLSKGAILSHQNIIKSLQQADLFFGPSFNCKENLIVTALPLFHAYALTVNCLYFLKKGGCNLLISNPKDTGSFINELKNYQFNYFTGLNTLFETLLSDSKFHKIDFSQLKITLSGGMSTQATVANHWHKVTGNYIIAGYGMTECSPMISVSLPCMNYFSRSVGIPMVGTQLRLRKTDNTLVDSLQKKGEIEVKGPQVMRGYWNNITETNEVLKNGWFSTGDIGFFDDEGFLNLVDRKKELIIVSGFNVYPNEVETVVNQLSGVTECAVVGVNDRYSGERVKLFVVLNNPDLTFEKIIQHCKQYLTAYKCPKQIEIVETLPKNNLGKVLKHKL
ncbi:long-chain-fatty-acid--CoA ligase [Psychromonas sp. psych-6C06]|uniref:AMP-binding protein n=1 Tax=Psychromonas sp. psych-6C06 TaxID=2058089 RepID=UPI000C331615|nr:AMP-binding protein [Psychromonas sp. psych-6C06]PKF61077.1 long-chain-fatty-acid--CoA ligase [Psychromonas sp. psych-6C06]